MVAMLLSYLYYFKGKQAIRRDKKRIVLSMSSRGSAMMTVNEEDDNIDESQ
jgi:hypothetical protein